MKFAAFEAATEWCSVALWLDGEIAGIEELAGNRHSERMLPLFEKLLEMKNIAARELDAVAFGAGSWEARATEALSSMRPSVSGSEEAGLPMRIALPSGPSVSGFD